MILIDNGVCIRSERTLNRDIGIEFSILVEVNDPQLVGRPDLASGWIEFTTQQAQECGFPAPVGADEAYSHLRLDRDIDSTKESPFPNRIFEILDFDQLF